VMDGLHASASFEVPRALLDAEVARMQETAVEDLKKRGMTTQNLSLPADLFVERATRRLKLSILVSELVRRENLQPRPEQVRKLIEEHAESFEQPEQLDEEQPQAGVPQCLPRQPVPTYPNGRYRHWTDDL